MNHTIVETDFGPWCSSCHVVDPAPRSHCSCDWAGDFLKDIGQLPDDRCPDCGASTVVTKSAGSRTHDGPLGDVRECPECGWGELVESEETDGRA